MTLQELLSHIPTEDLIAHIEARGYQINKVEVFGKWTTLADLANMVRRKVGSLSRTISIGYTRNRTIPGLEVQRGEAGRIIKLRYNPDFFGWLENLTKQNGR